MKKLACILAAFAVACPPFVQADAVDDAVVGVMSGLDAWVDGQMQIAHQHAKAEQLGGLDDLIDELDPADALAADLAPALKRVGIDPASVKPLIDRLRVGGAQVRYGWRDLWRLRNRLPGKLPPSPIRPSLANELAVDLHLALPVLQDKERLADYVAIAKQVIRNPALPDDLPWEIVGTLRNIKRLPADQINATDRVRRSKRLRIGAVVVGWPYVEFVGDSMDGIEARLAAEFAWSLGAEPVYTEVTRKSGMVALARGDLDMVIGAFRVVPTNPDKVAFAAPWHSGGLALVTTCSKILSIPERDFTGIGIGTHILDDEIRDVLGQADVRYTPNLEELIRVLDAGVLDAVVVHTPEVAFHLARRRTLCANDRLLKRYELASMLVPDAKFKRQHDEWLRLFDLSGKQAVIERQFLQGQRAGVDVERYD